MLEQPDLSWSGTGYLDSNFGAEPLEAGFSRLDLVAGASEPGFASCCMTPSGAMAATSRWRCASGPDGAVQGLPSAAAGATACNRLAPGTADPGRCRARRASASRPWRTRPFMRAAGLQTQLYGEQSGHFPRKPVAGPLRLAHRAARCYPSGCRGVSFDGAVFCRLGVILAGRTDHISHPAQARRLRQTTEFHQKRKSWRSRCVSGADCGRRSRSRNVTNNSATHSNAVRYPTQASGGPVTASNRIHQILGLRQMPRCLPAGAIRTASNRARHHQVQFSRARHMRAGRDRIKAACAIWTPISA